MLRSPIHYTNARMKYTPLTEALHQYICALFPVEDDALRRINEDAARAGMPPIQIAPEQLAFLHVLLAALGAERVLEIGSLAGYSAIGMARALPANGKVVCFEREAPRAEFIRHKADEAGVAHKIEVHAGEAKRLLERYLVENPHLMNAFDLVFIDAEKAGYPRYLELSLPLLRTGGMVVADNTLAWGNIADTTTDDKTVLALQAFNRAVAEHPSLCGCIVPIGEGMTLAVKL